MQRFVLASLLVCLAVLALAACKANDGADAGRSRTAANANTRSTVATENTATAPTPPVDTARRITIRELEAALKKNEAVVVDVRGQDSYNASHIKGAIWIQETDILKRSDELPKDKLIVTYCA